MGECWGEESRSELNEGMGRHGELETGERKKSERAEGRT